MIKEIIHIGLTVNSLEESINFYKNILGLKYIGEILMQGKETDILFQQKDCIAKVAYLNGSDDIKCPPVELIEFINPKIKKDEASLFKTSISEICFLVDDIDKVYKNLKNKGVKFLSEPQFFDFSADNFSKSKAVYFEDNNGIILELMEYID